jgi:hypothetical protein
MTNTRVSKRIWPTLLAAASQAAVRVRMARNGAMPEVCAAVVMSRTALDAYLHEIIELRKLPAFVVFAAGPRGKRRLSRNKWRMIADSRLSLKGMTRAEKAKFSDIRELSLIEKLQIILLLMHADHRSNIVSRFEDEFDSLLQLNALRNAIVHHDFAGPSGHLANTCERISAKVGLHLGAVNRPWEDILTQPELAAWACVTVAQSILSLEELEHNRKIHLIAGRDTILSSISPLEL